MNKSYVLLCLCERLKNGEELNIGTCCLEHKISIPTFRRYISLLKNFFWQELGEELIYDCKNQVYKIKTKNI